MMKNYKICIYAICKNEEKFVERWVNSMKEADEIVVLDTGSTDNTVKLLKSMGVRVKQKKISPWRFDVARNESLKMIPKDCDICISTDLDEIFEPGWRKKVEAAWKKDTTKLRFTYHWSFDEQGKPSITFYYEKAHDPKKYRWIHPVHEVLEFLGDQEHVVVKDDLVLNHYPDATKSRSSYLPLLELSVSENPTNDRNMHYLGREYMYYGKWNEAIDTLIRHLNLETATWKDERAASMRFIARCYTNLKRYEEARMWLEKAISEAPYLRDAYLERALLEYQFENWNIVERYCLSALEINSHQKSYINEPFSWNETVYDLLSLSAFYQNRYQEAVNWINHALEINPNSERLVENKKIMLMQLEKKAE